jgi:non-lysosomal glucosylceramidase
MDSIWCKVNLIFIYLFIYYWIFSAYCGGLHIAALRVCVEMARILNDKNALEEYEAWLILAKKSYSDKLWNGKYYNYDSSPSRHHDSIMSDQLAGFWYLRLCGHKYDVKFSFRRKKN